MMEQLYPSAFQLDKGLENKYALTKPELALIPYISIKHQP